MLLGSESERGKPERKEIFSKDSGLVVFRECFLYNIYILGILMHMSTKPCASIRVQTIIQKYAKFLMYIASKSAYNQNSTKCNPYLNKVHQ